jgi:hypothetical protein
MAINYEEKSKPVVKEADQPKGKHTRNRPKNPSSVESMKPWEFEGISRRTWYARRREQRIAEASVREAMLASKPIAKPKPEPEPDDDIWG